MKDVEEVDISCFMSPEQVMWNDDELDHEMTDTQRRRFVNLFGQNIYNYNCGPNSHFAIRHARHV